MTNTAKFAALVIALLVCMPAAADHSLNGTWDAWLDVPGGKLRFQIAFKADGAQLTGKIGSTTSATITLSEIGQGFRLRWVPGSKSFADAFWAG